MNDARTPQSTVDDLTQSWCIGLAASPSLRRGPASPLAQLLREIEPCLRYLGAEIYAVEGALHTIIRCGLLRTLPQDKIHGMPSGRLGGLVDIGAAVVARRVVGVSRVFGDRTNEVASRLGLDREVDAVVYLLDPYDSTARLPETLALKRECVVKGKPFLATVASVREWFSLHAMAAAARPGAPDSTQLFSAFVDDAEAKRIGLAPRGHQSVALIAHNQRKLELAQFAAAHHGFLNGFAHRFGTGTSAGVVNAVCEGGEPCPRSDSEMNALAQRVRENRRIDKEAGIDGRSVSTPDQWVEELDSGPEGGDLQAAEAILMGVCDTAIFFEDPSSPHEHDADIEVFERAARVWNLPERRLNGWGVTCLHDPESASTWAKLWTAHGGTPTTATYAFRARYGVELVAVDPRHEDNPQAAWAAVLVEAAWYLFSSIMAAGWSRALSWQPGAGAAQQLGVVVPPGRGMADVIREMKQLVEAPHRNTKAHNDELDRALKDVIRMVQREPGADRMIGRAKSFLDRKRLAYPWNPNVLSDILVVAPATGTFGSPIRGIEANGHADALADVFDANTVSCAPTVFTTARTGRRADGAREPDPPYERHWAASDLLVLTCDAVDENYLSDRGRVPMPEGLGEEMVDRKKAVGHLAGLFLGADGKLLTSHRYERCGISAKRIRDVAAEARRGVNGKDSVLVATQDIDGRRLRMINAVLEGGYVSTLITDTATALRVLQGARPKRRGSSR